ncbi:hypothetical protein, partial [Shimazuella kribbensis]|uniref:hypothetical protein n=1 Tax=Shimazuella kribbensis TaxID=139808 RepID=UPI001B7FD1E4
MDNRSSRINSNRRERQRIARRREEIRRRLASRVNDTDVYLYNQGNAPKGSARTEDAVQGHHMPPQAYLRRVGIKPSRVPVIAVEHPQIHEHTTSFRGGYSSPQGQARYNNPDLSFVDVMIEDCMELANIPSDNRYNNSIKEMIDLYDQALQNPETYASNDVDETNVEEMYRQFFGDEREKIDQFITELEEMELEQSNIQENEISNQELSEGESEEESEVQEAAEEPEVEEESEEGSEVQEEATEETEVEEEPIEEPEVREEATEEPEVVEESVEEPEVQEVSKEPEVEEEPEEESEVQEAAEEPEVEE